MMLDHLGDGERAARIQNAFESTLREGKVLTRDLGAESIDFLDIVFRLERQFNLKIPREELFPESIFAGDPKFVTDGKVNAAGLVELQTRMPYADLRDFEQDRRLSAVAGLFTVDLVTRYVAWKLAQGAGAGSNNLGPFDPNVIRQNHDDEDQQPSSP